MTNSELREVDGLPGGASLTRVLENLELCGFIRDALDRRRGSHGRRYVVSDPFTAFHLRFIDTREVSSWTSFAGSQGYFAWRGLAFERLIPAFAAQVKEALGIRGIEALAYAWRCAGPNGGAQVDLVIDRKDGIVDLCEVKFTDAPYRVTAVDSERFARARELFIAETGTRKAVHLVLVSANGVEPGRYASNLQAVITADDLFR